MAWTTPDISAITQTLYDLLTTALNNSTSPPLNIPHFNVNISCASPETARSGTDCQLSLYLLHVGRDPYWRNTPRDGPRAQLNSTQPLSLNLYYLLTAWADKDFVHEQQAMSIALQCLHSQPIYRPGGTDEEFTISIEADTIEEMSRLWQAFNTPIRLSCMVKVGVVFVTPALTAPPPAPPPVVANLAVGAEVGGGPLLFEAADLAVEPPSAADPTAVSLSLGAPLAVGGSTLSILGAGLDLPAASQVFLSTADGLTEWRVSPAWRQTPVSPDQLDLVLPVAYADPATALPAPPAATPAPGVYLLSVGRNTPAPAVRSNTIPVTIAARIDSLARPALPTGVYTLTGAGFAPGATALDVGGTDLAAVGAGPPGPGRFFVDPAGATITFALATPGSFPLAVVVNGVASPAAGWRT
jgi:hypothetical protein